MLVKTARILGIVGRLLKGAKETIKSVFGNSQPAIPEENSSCRAFRPSSGETPNSAAINLYFLLQLV